jgi:hypothetical protein
MWTEVEEIALALLRRYGVVFMRMLARGPSGCREDGATF